MTFFAQYAICYILAAVPMLYMEIAMGQYSSASPWGIYQMLCPAMSGVPAVMGFTLVLRSIATSVWIAQFLALSGIIVSEMTGLWDTTADFINCKDSCYDHRLALRCTFVMPSENETDCKPFLQSLLYTRGDDRRSTPLVFLMEAVLREAQLGASDSIIPDTSLLLALVVTWAVTGLTSVLGLRFFSKFALACCRSIKLIDSITMGDIARAVRRISTPHFNLLGSYEDWLTAAGQALITLKYYELYLFEDQQNRFDLLDLETFMPMAIVAEACLIAGFLKFSDVQKYIWLLVFVLFTLIWIPLNFVFKNIERQKICEPVQALFRPRKDWGPMNKKNRDSALRMERAQRVR
ncbi:unnamed protein product [Heligmosomoides polygyrus]|uniref:Anoctamin n=1 Tax=Heligmosomoides polygyrus TaxID=6339 RepID=A0A3P7X6H8_HELPZ|nr:unnamed protein product [Heligmosomoides polygyrus]